MAASSPDADRTWLPPAAPLSTFSSRVILARSSAMSQSPYPPKGCPCQLLSAVRKEVSAPGPRPAGTYTSVTMKSNRSDEGPASPRGTSVMARVAMKVSEDR